MSNKRVTAAMETFLIGFAETALPPSGDLVGAGSALNIANGQLAVMSVDHDGTAAFGEFLGAGTSATDVKAIQVLQGTPNSNQLYEVSPFNDGHLAVVKSNVIKANKVRSIASHMPALPRNSMVYISNVANLDDNTRYKLTIQLEGERTDLTHGMNRDVISATYDLPGSGTVSNLLQNLAMKVNRSSVIVAQANPMNFGGNRPFIVLGIDANAGSGTTIGTLTAGTNVNIATYTLPDGSTQTVSMVMTPAIINSLNEAIGNVSGLSADTIVVMTEAATNAVTGLLVIGLDEKITLGYDNIKEVKTRVTAGISGVLTSSIDTVATPFEGRGLYRATGLRYKDRAELQIFNLQNHPVKGEYFIVPVNYFDGAVEGYAQIIIEHFDEDNSVFNNAVVHDKRLYILLPCEIDDAGATAATGYAWSFVNAEPYTSLNATLGAWLSDADDVFNNISYKGLATKTDLID